MESKPRLLLMGLRRSGKSSIQNVVFHKMQPNDTLFLDSTSKVSRNDVLSFIDFDLWDFPGNIDTADLDLSVFQRCGALVFVIDAQDDFMEALQRLYSTVITANHINKNMSFEVFIHKVDGLSDDHKIDTQREIHQRLMDELSEAGMEHIHLSFHLTSIYDHSIFEAFSKVVQKLIVQLPTLENLLNMLCSNSGIEKAFLFDTTSKIYIATDSSPVDMQSYELCSDAIDVILDMTCIYDSKTSDSVSEQESSAIIHLDNGILLYLYGVNEQLALVSLIRKEHFEKQGLIDFNFKIVCEAILEVCSKN